MSDPMTAFARTLLDTAAQLEADEARIRAAVLAAARAGDLARVLAIAERWEHLPACEVLAEQHQEGPATGLAGCEPGV